jgi:hypothetical protein
MRPREFFSLEVAVQNEVEASAYWPWLFLGETCLVDSAGLEFHARHTNGNNTPVEGFCEADGCWVRAQRHGVVRLGCPEPSAFSLGGKLPMPFAIAMSYLLACSGWLVLHAAIVAQSDQGRALLITGASGAGKSTLSDSAYQLGWNVYGDDLVAVRRDTYGRLMGFGLRDFLRIRTAHGPKIIEVASLAEPAWITELCLLRNAGRRQKTMVQSANVNQCYADVLSSFSFGYAWFGADAVRETISEVMQLRTWHIEPGAEILSDSSAMLEMYRRITS